MLRARSGGCSHVTLRAEGLLPPLVGAAAGTAQRSHEPAEAQPADAAAAQPRHLQAAHAQLTRLAHAAGGAAVGGQSSAAVGTPRPLLPATRREDGNDGSEGAGEMR